MGTSRARRTQYQNFYIAHIGGSFLLIHGFQKKQNRTPAKEIAIAEKRLKELKTRT